MTTTDIIFALLISITIMLCIWSWILTGFMNEMRKNLKDIQDNQFDAEQVMKLYQMKHTPKPQIITEKRNIVPLYADYNLPNWAEKEVEEEEIKIYLANEISKQIIDYIEVECHKDIVEMETKYKARLQVVDCLSD